MFPGLSDSLEGRVWDSDGGPGECGLKARGQAGIMRSLLEIKEFIWKMFFYGWLSVRWSSQTSLWFSRVFIKECPCVSHSLQRTSARVLRRGGVVSRRELSAVIILRCHLRHHTLPLHALLPLATAEHRTGSGWRSRPALAFRRVPRVGWVVESAGTFCPASALNWLIGVIIGGESHLTPSWLVGHLFPSSGTKHQKN